MLTSLASSARQFEQLLTITIRPNFTHLHRLSPTPSHPYDQSAAIRPLFTITPRPSPQNPYDPNSAILMMRKKCVTTRPRQARKVHGGRWDFFTNTPRADCRECRWFTSSGLCAWCERHPVEPRLSCSLDALSRGGECRCSGDPRPKITRRVSQVIPTYPKFFTHEVPDLILSWDDLGMPSQACPKFVFNALTPLTYCVSIPNPAAFCRGAM